MRNEQISMTARGVAAYRVGFDRIPWSAGNADADLALQTAVADGMDPGDRMVGYLRSRTAFFDRAVVAAHESGISQFVAVGAGYDGRCLRYAAAGATWFELDHPATQADKRARLDELGIEVSAIVFVPVDFDDDDGGGALTGVGFDATRPALFSSEGVLAYLSERGATTLLQSLGEVAAPLSRFAVEVPLVPDTAEQILRRQRLEDTVDAIGEPLRFSVPRGQVATFMTGTGWHVTSAVDPAGADVATSTISTAFVLADRA